MEKNYSLLVILLLVSLINLNNGTQLFDISTIDLVVDDTLSLQTGDEVKVFNVDDFGAIGDGEREDTNAFKNAWKEVCSSSCPSVLKVPHGKTYLIKLIKFGGPCRSPITVKVYGTILAPEDPASWKGLNRREWIRFKWVDNLVVEGGGKIYGNGKKWWEQSCKVDKSRKCKPAPTALIFESMQNLIIRNLTTEDSQQMHIKFRYCNKVRADHLKVLAPGHSPNTDGIHVSASKNVVISNSIVGTGDDCVSIVSNSSDIRIENISCGPSHGISIGSLGKHNSEEYVSDISVNNAILHNCTNGLRIKTWQGGSGFAKRISFQNVYMENVKHPIIIDQYYCDSKKPCDNETSSLEVMDISYMDIKGTSATKEVMRFACSKTLPCNNIVLKDIDLSVIKGSTATTFCENVIGYVIGNVIPEPCLQGNMKFKSKDVVEQIVSHQTNDM